MQNKCSICSQCIGLTKAKDIAQEFKDVLSSIVLVNIENKCDKWEEKLYSWSDVVVKL